MSMEMFSERLERHALGGLIKNPQVYPEISNFVSEKDFHHEVHNVIFCVLINLINKDEKFDPIILAQKIKNLGISFKDDLNIFDYIDGIVHAKFSEKTTIEAFKELADLKIRRNTVENAQKIIEHVQKSKAEPLDKVITEVDNIYASNIKEIFSEDAGQDLCAGVRELIEERGNNPQEEIGFQTKFECFNKFYGGLVQKNLYIVASRSGEGKTTFLFDLCQGILERSKEPIKVLHLDSEMSGEEMKFRLVSRLSGIPQWYLESGNFRRNQEMIDKLEKVWPLIKSGNYFHYEVPDKNIDQIASLCLRWKAKHINRTGNNTKMILLYDYIKPAGEKTSNFQQEYQIMGDKAHKLKRLAEALDCPVISAIQLNRGGESKNKSKGNFSDDSSAISMSDRISWVCSGLWIFRQKTLEEFTEDGEERGTHKLIRLKGRKIGKEAVGFQDRLFRTYEDGTERYENNYINYNVSNFKIEERGSLIDIINEQSQQHDIMDGTGADPEIELV